MGGRWSRSRFGGCAAWAKRGRSREVGLVAAADVVRRRGEAPGGVDACGRKEALDEPASARPKATGARRQWPQGRDVLR